MPHFGVPNVALQLPKQHRFLCVKPEHPIDCATPIDHAQLYAQLNAARIFEVMKQAHPAAMRGMTAYSLNRVLPQLVEWIHTVKGNVYRVVEI